MIFLWSLYPSTPPNMLFLLSNFHFLVQQSIGLAIFLFIYLFVLILTLSYLHIAEDMIMWERRVLLETPMGFALFCVAEDILKKPDVSVVCLSLSSCQYHTTYSQMRRTHTILCYINMFPF